jgi:hypothetical protein
MSALQLTLDGREVEYSQVLAERHGFSDAQREIMRAIRLQGFVTASEAGRIVHAARGHCAGHARFPARRTGEMCCRYGPTDGSDALRRLRERGLISKLRLLRAWTFATLEPASASAGLSERPSDA